MLERFLARILDLHRPHRGIARQEEIEMAERRLARTEEVNHRIRRLAVYNAEQARGIMHTPGWKAMMSLERDWFRELNTNLLRRTYYGPEPMLPGPGKVER